MVKQKDSSGFQQSMLLHVGKKGQDVNTQVPRRHKAGAQHVIQAPGVRAAGSGSMPQQVAPLILSLTCSRSVYEHLCVHSTEKMKAHSNEDK